MLMTMRHAFLTMVGGAAMLLLCATGARAAAPGPTVLFVGGVHARYIAQPLHAQGIEVDSCTSAELPARLATGQYHVVVPTNIYEKTPETLAALDRFLAQGGGVLLTYWGPPRQGEEPWRQVNAWLAQYGIRRRWEVLSETNPANSFTDVMRMKHSWSAQLFPPVNAGVDGVMTLCHGKEPGGYNPPMTSDFSPEWTVVVRTAATVKSVPATMVKDQLALPYAPREMTVGALPLMAVREAGKGRLALVGISAEWIFQSPPFCPTSEVMLTEGLGGKPSGWLRVFANTFRWLASPSLAAGRGGARTPAAVLHPPVKLFAPQPPLDWKAMPRLGDQPQLQGLVGARTALSSGTGSVAEYAKAARDAGLHYIVFLEDSLRMNAEKWHTLVTQCAAVSDDTFGAIPGLTIEDAQGNHFYVCGDNAMLPPATSVFPDGRLKTVHTSRTDAMFEYIIQALRLRAVVGYWQHDKNFLPVADYKLYNSFPIYSFSDGQPVDNAFDDYLYLMGHGGCHAVFALELMHSPAQVAQRARAGWRVVATTGGDYGDGTYVQTLPMGVKGLREKWKGALGWYPPYQYITNGPRILSWSCQQICANPNGEWWRPDYWQYRVHLHVAGDAPLRTVTIYDGDRGVFRQWRPAGNDFAADLVLTHGQQRDLVLVVEDATGCRAISMEIWNRNLLMNQYICGDRCNFLGNARLRARDGSQRWLPVGFRANLGVTPSKGGWDAAVNPAIALTPNAPGLPIDGQPIGFPSPGIEINPRVPGEYPDLFNSPSTYLISPEIAVGQSNYRLAYDPGEKGATKTPLGYDYVDPEKQFGGKNAWTSWYRTLPTKLLGGWNRIFACNTLGDVRVGWYEAHLEPKQTVICDPAVGVPFATAAGAWELYVNGVPVAEAKGPLTGTFGRGVFAVQMTPGGSVVLIGTDERVRYMLRSGLLSLAYLPEGGQMPVGRAVDFSVAWLGASGALTKAQVLEAVRQLGVLTPGAPAYAAQLRLGRTTDTYLRWRVEAQGEGMAARLRRTAMDAFLTLEVTGLRDNWDVYLLDRARKAPNFRALPLRDGRTFAQLDLNDADLDLFVGHPLVCDRPDIKLLVSWKEPGRWHVEAHNPGDAPVKTTIRTHKEWTLFPFRAQVELAPGSSKTWLVSSKKW
jgi:hypothetical protein